MGRTFQEKITVAMTGIVAPGEANARDERDRLIGLRGQRAARYVLAEVSEGVAKLVLYRRDA